MMLFPNEVGRTTKISCAANKFSIISFCSAFNSKLKLYLAITDEIFAMWVILGIYNLILLENENNQLIQCSLHLRSIAGGKNCGSSFRANSKLISQFWNNNYPLENSSQRNHVASRKTSMAREDSKQNPITGIFWSFSVKCDVLGYNMQDKSNEG